LSRIEHRDVGATGRSLLRRHGASAAVVVLGGPTASGKSALALAIAGAVDGVVINADSMQVYRELPILTAQPSAEAQALAPHRLYGFVPAAERCSVARWRAAAQQEISAALGEGRLPVVVGGTGLYLRALIEGLAPIPDIPAELRAAAQERLAELGPAGLHAELARRDPPMAARLGPTDRQRLLRAWEVLEATGRSLADWQRQPGAGLAAEGLPLVRLALLPGREALYAACNARFEAMLERGGLAEAAAVAALRLDPDLPAMKALGVRELLAHLRDERVLPEAVAAAQQATRNYAKRQMTWLRHQAAEFHRLEPEPNAQFSERFLGEIFNIIRNTR
jgi:tRNA dimethylallyltransferase